MKPFNTSDIDGILKTHPLTRKSFLGTYPACVFPKTNKKVYSFVSNTSDHLDDGSHWIGWMIDSDRATFFDSYGRSPDDYTLPHHFKTFAKKFRTVQFTKRRIQGWNSVACGYFCIHFIYIFSLGLDYENFLNDYSRSDFKRNDSIVYGIVKSII